MKQKIKIGILIFTILLNILSWCSRTFSDWYIAKIMPLWIHTYSRFMSLFPFSVGEKLILLAIFLLMAGIVIFFLGFIKSDKLKTLRRRYWSGISWIVVIVFLIQTLNCFILYHASTMEEQYFEAAEDYGFEELSSLREDMVKKLNSLSTRFERDKKGEIIYKGDLYQKCIESMQKLGKKYSNLSGYYPTPKKIYFSDFMSQQYLSGIYFPFTLEANYNTSMYITNMPFTICHELAHLKGYIYEDEANFIAFMACIEADEPFLQYSGYLNVLNYVSTDYKNSANEKAWNSRTLISKQVASDLVFLTDETWDRINKSSPFSTDTVETISNHVINSSLRLNGVTDGIKSYHRVVRLLIYYYSRRI